MAIFNYQARSKNGDVRVGRVEASSKKVAADILQRQGLVIVAIERVEEAPIYTRRLKIFEKIKTKDIVIFSRQLATLFQAEVPLVMALGTVAKQTDNTLFREKISEISADIEGGSSLSDSLAKHPDIFSDFYVHMIRAGEASGKLDGSLEYLADHTEREYEVNSKIRGAMIYPSFVMIGFFVAFVIIMVLVIPRLVGVLEESGQELPFFTKIIIETSDFMRAGWYILAGAIIGGIIILLRYIKTEQGKRIWDRIQLKIPIIGGILTKVYIFRFAESLSTLIEGGVPIMRALSISGDIAGNTVYKEIINQARENVKKGGTLGSTLAGRREVPPLLSQMVVVGEQAGKLVSVLHSVAAFYQKDVDRSVDNITSLIEPILIVAMGAGVGILLAGVLLPIYNMAGAL